MSFDKAGNTQQNLAKDYRSALLLTDGWPSHMSFTERFKPSWRLCWTAIALTLNNKTKKSSSRSSKNSKTPKRLLMFDKVLYRMLLRIIRLTWTRPNKVNKHSGLFFEFRWVFFFPQKTRIRLRQNLNTSWPKPCFTSIKS